MEWMEIIKVRTAGNGQGIDNEFLEHAEGMMKSPGLSGVRVYAHASVSSDLMILLTWGTAPQPWGSDLAHSLSQELKRYGLVDHSVWIEKKNK
ncbi:hypothetical protein QUF80_05240 [Desulfococcaceae bacterium HSG8]|nr:hypothetical protein [Desulfococcaceae bacterium HSG8]